MACAIIGDDTLRDWPVTNLSSWSGMKFAQFAEYCCGSHSIPAPLGPQLIASFSSFCEDLLNRQHSFVQMYAEFNTLAFPLLGFFGRAHEPDKNIKNVVANFVQRLTAGLRCAWSNKDAFLRQRTWVQLLVRRYRVDRLGCTTHRWRWAGGWLLHMCRPGASRSHSVALVMLVRNKMQESVLQGFLTHAPQSVSFAPP